MINIIVCVKQVPDPEAPVSSFKIDPEAKRAISGNGIPPVLNPFDENALEAALRIKDAQPARITVISMGQRLARPVLQKTLAVGADELILLEDETFDSFDSYFTAYVIAAAIKKIGTYDLILCGREAADSDAGQVGPGMAEILDIPGITIAQKVDVIDGQVKVERIITEGYLDGYEVIEAPMPALVTASNEIGELRSTTVMALLEARKKKVTIWNSQDLGLDASFPSERSSMLKLFIPVREVNGELVTGDSPRQAGENLALKLKEADLI